MARLAAGQGLAGQLGPLQPLVLRQLSPGLPPLESVVVAGPEPLPVPLPVPLPEAPPAEVPALLALLLAQPLVVAQPPARGQAPGIAPQAPRVSAAGPLPQPLALPEVAARAPPLRLRAHGVPGAARPAPGPVPHEVPQQDPFRLSEKDRMELLEIAKANAAKALGTTNFELPASLRAVLVARETSHGAAVPNDGAKAEKS